MRWLLTLQVVAACHVPVTSTAAQTSTVTATPGPYTTPWPAVSLIQGANTGPLRGADGADQVGDEIAVPWEEGSSASRLNLKTGVLSTTTITGSGPEDARLCDLDGDGLQDLLIVGRSRLYVVFGGTTAPVTLTASILGTHPIWIQAQCADFNGDGRPDIFAGSYSGTKDLPATGTVFYNPGTRLGTDWTQELATIAGWVMSAIPTPDGAVVITDRAAYRTPDNVIHYDRQGIRYLTREFGAWVNHPLLSAPYTGDQMFAALGDVDGDGSYDVVGVRSHIGVANNYDIFYGPAPFSRHDVITDKSHPHSYAQGPLVVDLTGDGRADLVITSWEANVCCDEVDEGVWWLQHTLTGWQYNALSGGHGTKYDNSTVLFYDGTGRPGVATTEQLDQDGLEVFLNPGFAPPACAPQGAQ